MEKRTLKFSIDKAKVLKEFSDSQLAILEVWVCHDGNNAHNYPIPLKSIQEASETLLNKPLIAEYVNSDFGTHTDRQQIIGFFPKQNNLRYEEENGKTYLVADAILFKYYATWAYEIFVDDNDRSVSMEISVLETEINDLQQEEIKVFSFNAVTVLGKNINPACAGSNAKVIKFSKMVEEAEKVLGFANNSNPDNINPNKDGDKMPFNREEHAVQFSMTAQDMMNMMREACGQMKYQVEDREYSKYWMTDYDATYMYAYDEQEGGTFAIPYSIEEGNVNPDFENAKPCKMVSNWVVTEEKEFSEVFEAVKEKFSIELKEKDELHKVEIEKFETSLAETKQELETTKEEFAKVNTELEEVKQNFSKTNEELENQKFEFTSLKEENEQLKMFKTNIEQKEFEAKVEFALSEVSETMPQDKVEEWREKSKEFSIDNVDSWCNAIKADAYNYAKGIIKNEGITRFALPHVPEKKKSGLWD